MDLKVEKLSDQGDKNFGGYIFVYKSGFLCNKSETTVLISAQSSIFIC